MYSARRGFTIIELLVVIAIIAVLVIIGLVAYSQVGPKARDSNRKENLRAIAQALEIYYQANKRYPRTLAGGYNLSSGTNPWITDDGTPTSPGPRIALGSSYLETLPTDSKSNGGNAITATGNNTVLGYAYWSNSVSGTGCPIDTSGGQYFILGATLENQNDAERDAVKNYRRCDGVDITTNNNAFIVTSPQ